MKIPENDIFMTSAIFGRLLLEWNIREWVVQPITLPWGSKNEKVNLLV
jgi:hypothetical protein